MGVCCRTAVVLAPVPCARVPVLLLREIPDGNGIRVPASGYETKTEECLREEKPSAQRADPHIAGNRMSFGSGLRAATVGGTAAPTPS